MLFRSFFPNGLKPRIVSIDFYQLSLQSGPGKTAAEHSSNGQQMFPSVPGPVGRRDLKCNVKRFVRKTFFGAAAGFAPSGASRPEKKGIICRDCPLFLRLVSFCHSEEPSDEESVSKRRLLTVLCLLPSSLQNRARLQAHAAFVGRLGLSILQ